MILTNQKQQRQSYEVDKTYISWPKDKILLDHINVKAGKELTCFSTIGNCSIQGDSYKTQRVHKNT